MFGEKKKTSVHFTKDSENSESAVKKMRERKRRRKEWET
jgi:hypothetical protein